MLRHTYEKTSLAPIVVNHYGFDTHQPNQSHGPAIWDCYLIYYIIEGNGICTIDGKTYPLTENQGFLIEPEQIAYYAPTENTPWKYCYIGLHGTDIKKYLSQAQLSCDNPIFTYKSTDTFDGIIHSLVQVEHNIKIRETTHLSLIYRLISNLIETAEDGHVPVKNNGKRNDYYLNLATSYITNNYSTKLAMSDVAKHVGLNSSYLGSLFKKNCGLSPQEFLKTTRIERACQLMYNPTLTIGDISRSVGYNDQLQFSKIFKKAKGISPKKYRDNL